eukprot:CAMPEP_0182422864 /NCGR_PEP_ID=MMETSP1167-20130531/8682_1 /TAXON_ID=2988 /ORGANISM="Mallomonas Sp, Strain CCMP3275" /LENGTH=472 /DNA_ID=CAMNT_0024601297 /DNA_START=33 /DNA_END=1451 /DNA_ORIENTATION=+
MAPTKNKSVQAKSKASKIDEVPEFTEKDAPQTQDLLLSPAAKVSGRDQRTPTTTPKKSATTPKRRKAPGIAKVFEDNGNNDDGKKSESELPDGKKNINADDDEEEEMILHSRDIDAIKSPSFHISTTTVHPRVQKVYQIVRKSTGALGGNGYDGAIYGELTMHSMQKIIDFLVSTCHMSSSSRFIDVGSGLGKPNFHAAQYPGVRVSIGVELEDIRWKLAMHNLDSFLKVFMKQSNVDTSVKQTITTGENKGEREREGDKAPSTPSKSTRTTYKEVESTSSPPSESLYGGVNFMCGDIDRASSTDPFTHIYMYDLGFPPDLQRNIANKFNNSIHARYLISYRPPHRVAGEEYGYNVELVGQMPTHMHGSGEVHTAYFYKRILPPSLSLSLSLPSAPPTGTSFLTLPGRKENNEQDERVVCDDMFLSTVTLAAGRERENERERGRELAEHCSRLVQSFLNEGRPKRERKSRNI